MSEEGLNFSPGSKIEAKDFNEKWHSARVVETDWSEGEVLVHFNESKFDEWIPMDSSRFRRHPKGLKFPDEQSNKTVFAIGGNKHSYLVSKQDLEGKKRKSKTEIFHTGFKKAMNSDEAKKDNLNCLFYDKYNSRSEMIDNVTKSDFLINNYEECTDSLEEIKDDTYKCPMSGCNKTFRKDNLLQMHLKFYHPEYSTLFNTLPNATKLAFVKTVDESVEHLSKKPEACSSVTPNTNKVMQNFFMFHSDEHKKGTDNKGKFDVENQNKNQNNSEIVTNCSIKTDKLHKDEIINCTCGYQGEDGLMIQCDLCLCWQHSYCNDIEKEEDVPEKYVCYICQNSRRQRISKKYFNEQDWIHEGKLPNISKYSTDSVETRKRVAMLKRSFDLISILLKVQNVVHSLRVKLEVACKKDHPKLYLWAKTWSKKTISLLKLDPVPVIEIMKDKTFNDDFFDGTINETLMLSKTNDSIETLIVSDTELLQILEEENEDSKPKTNIVLNKSIPKLEAPINATECKRRLLEHLDNFQNYLDRILSFVEVQTSALEDMDNTEKNVHNEHGQTKQTIQMLIYDLELMKRLSAS